jgi:hypothetical protein
MAKIIIDGELSASESSQIPHPLPLLGYLGSALKFLLFYQMSWDRIDIIYPKPKPANQIK